MAVTRISAADNYDPQWPATVLSDCEKPSLYIDVTAAGDSPAWVRQADDSTIPNHRFTASS
jgi:hypothetical protein